MTIRPVVVGVDGSDGSRAAVEWAADLAMRHGTPLVCTFGHATPMNGFLPAGAPATIDQAAAEIGQAHPGLDVSVRLVEGGGAAALIALSADATATVVGARGHGGFARLLLGSVANQVAAHGHGPVIVVREKKPSDGPILVGVDGSEEAALATAFAAREAELRDVRLLVMHAYTEVLRPETADAEQEGREAAQRLLTEAVEPYRHLRPQTQAVYSGRADAALIDASARASLTVVGSRGRGGLAGMVLGSVSHALSDHAHSPVAVVHPSPTAG